MPGGGTRSAPGETPVGEAPPDTGTSSADGQPSHGGMASTGADILEDLFRKVAPMITESVASGIKAAFQKNPNLPFQAGKTRESNVNKSPALKQDKTRDKTKIAWQASHVLRC